MLQEARRTPAVLAALPALRLPPGLSALGMGSSLYAAQLVAALGGRVLPLAAEDAERDQRRFDRALLISQSGASREVVAMAARVRRPLVITNAEAAPLTALPGAVVHRLGAGPEVASSSVTWLATCALLARGLGVAWPTPDARTWANWERAAQNRARRVAAAWARVNGIFCIGDGPYLPIARQIALVATEALKRPCVAMSTAAFDHGPKEAAPAALTWHLGHDGHEPERVAALATTLRRHRAPLVAWESAPPQAVAALATLTIARLARNDTFVLGAKATR